MDTTWNSAKSVYRDNMLQFKLTGESKYKVVADEAMASLQKILSTQKAKQSPQELHTEYLKQEDVLTGALMKQPQPSYTATPSMSWRYLVLGSLVITCFVLLVV
jgi:hypothetical protein